VPVHQLKSLACFGKTAPQKWQNRLVHLWKDDNNGLQIFQSWKAGKQLEILFSLYFISLFKLFAVSGWAGT
jgi:hypothetical protein